MPTNHRGVIIEGPRANLQTGVGHWKDSYDNNLPKRYMTPEDWKKETGNGY